jgi:hypothetical protein
LFDQIGLRQFRRFDIVNFCYLFDFLHVHCCYPLLQLNLFYLLFITILLQRFIYLNDHFCNIAACAAARRADGIRGPEQET